MIVRLWRGWTTAANADAYEELIRSTIFFCLSPVRSPSGT